ncbi:Serine/threonine-protein kinase PBS1 [Hibiscus syriacus]|uniref:Serine/threonine-protein kinase PBS1 n=1 Tax=Hibiscus syriacus TaxID=106335 RepID=A0A6A3BJW6_HIBSY|nr:mitogen-activated protein kinase kinase kinase 17-like [Hibiscus syriacus]KAE8715718.1 Serine/threonine-protein kinase PBS1 [Hibiscus syriacus]
MEWIRGDTIGFGSFGTVSMVLPKTGFSKSPLIAVKSCEVIDSVSLKNEKEVLDRIGSCPQIIRCLGDNYTVEKGGELYNLFLEYADKGSLADQVKQSGGILMESDVRRYARSILRGLRFVHSNGFVHCDIKLQNILLFGNGDVKIADFGLAKRNGEEQRRVEIRGTPLNIAPESVNENVYDSAVDIWALGCAIVEMFTGKPGWNFKPGTDLAALLIKIGVSDELPGIPRELSEEGKDFLGKCFVKDPKKRWTAEMLLDHPFMAGDDDIVSLNRCEEEESTSPRCSFEEFSASPRCPFEFPDWVSTQSSSVPSFSISSPWDRIRELACDKAGNWTISESWITLR